MGRKGDRGGFIPIGATRIVQDAVRVGPIRSSRSQGRFYVVNGARERERKRVVGPKFRVGKGGPDVRHIVWHIRCLRRGNAGDT